jgi:hypothetical protein
MAQVHVQSIPSGNRTHSELRIVYGAAAA